jgi:colanic acid/amylovoran biosynthesis glycosyltransferase
LNLRRHGQLAASLELLFSAVPLLPRRSFDVVHCHFGPNGVRAAALRETGVLDGPIVTTFHAYDLTKYLQKWGAHLYDRLFEQGDLFLAVSNRWRRRLLELGCPEDKVRVHHMGVDCRRLSSPPKHQPGHNVPRLLSVGRLVEKKGFEYGILAVVELIRAGRRCEYTIIGDGPLRSQLAELIEHLDAPAAVRLAGPMSQADVLEHLQASDVLLAPSVTASDGDQEGIPVVLMEAMATGLPIVSTRHSGIPELVTDGESGYLVDERDVAGLADRLAVLLDSPQQRQAMGKTGRRIVEQDFNIDILNDRLVEMFEGLTTRRAKFR